MIDHRIETFLTLCDTLNYTKTAKKLCITQPAVSQHIKYLENYYDTELFHYEGKQLSLTEKGKELQNYASVLRNNATRIHEKLHKDGSKEKRIRIGATKSIGDFVLPKAIVEFMKKEPDYLIEIASMNTKNLLKNIDNGSIDLAIVEGAFDRTGYECKVLKEEPFICVASSSLIKEEVKTLEDLFQYCLIVRERGSGTRSILEQYLHARSHDINDFHRYVQIDHFMTIKALIEAGLGISFLYHMVVEEEINRGTMIQIPFPGEPIYRPLHYVYGKDSLFKEKCEEFIDIFQKCLNLK